MDRSRTTTDWTCRRRRYWAYEHNGTGIAPPTSALELYMGQVLHDGLAAIAGQTLASGTADIDTIATTAQKELYRGLVQDDDYETVEFANEQSCLVEGLLRGFHRAIWPSLLARYPTIVCIEEEMVLHLYEDDDIILDFMAKPDLVLADAEGNLAYIEYKSTSSKRTEWINAWQTAVQLHSTCRAIEAHLNQPVSHVIVQGLYKGYESYGKQTSPFCYAYYRRGTPPFSRDETRYDYAQGFRKTPVWEQPGGVKAWVEGMPTNILGDQFPQTPPIYPNWSLVDAFFEQRIARELEIARGLDKLSPDVLGSVFPQTFEQCSPAWGRSCPFRMLCFGQMDPFKAGFTPRVPHHEPEAAAWAATAQKEPENDQAEQSL